MGSRQGHSGVADEPCVHSGHSSVCGHDVPTTSGAHEANVGVTATNRHQSILEVCGQVLQRVTGLILALCSTFGAEWTIRVALVSSLVCGVPTLPQQRTA